MQVNLNKHLGPQAEAGVLEKLQAEVVAVVAVVAEVPHHRLVVVEVVVEVDLLVVI